MWEIRFYKKYRYLAISTGSSISISSTYILFLTKLQKKANPVKWICPIITISREIYGHDMCIFIAESKSFELMIFIPKSLHVESKKEKAEPNDPAFVYYPHS